MKKTILTLLAAGAIAGAGAAPAAAASPKAACANTTDPIIQFVSSKPGACQSSIAKVGYDALTMGAFPSNAAAIGNCKTLEQTMFMAQTPEDGRAYPYQFYLDIRMLLEMLGEDEAVAYYDANADLFRADNRAECVQVLKRVHSGLAGPLFAALPGPPA
jgi:hypothetical protein